MKYDPHASNLIPSGTWCEAEITSAEEKFSKGGNEMIQADFFVYDMQGLRPTIRHYFVSTQPGFLKKLCSAIGLDFSAGEVNASQLTAKKMWVLIKIQEDKTGQFFDKNVIAAFSKDAPEGAKISAHSTPDLIDEDVPF